MGFVCLHLMNPKNIVYLIKSILKLNKDIIICIVDDNSPDGTYDILVENFLNHKIFISLKEKKKMVEEVQFGMDFLS